MLVNKGKRTKKNNLGKKTIGIIIFIIIIIILLIILMIKTSNQNNNNNQVAEPETIEEDNILESNIVDEPIPTKLDEIVSVEDMPKKMTAKTKVVYDVIGKIVIDKINVKKYILDRTTENSLNLAVTKLVGPEINTVGNFAITGHNYENIFQRLKDLEIGDEFYLVGTDGRKVTYTIYDKYSIHPKDSLEEEECLNQNTNGKREVTLITCNKGAVTRLILKAQEKNLGGI